MCDVLSTCSLGVVFGFVSNQKFSDSIGGFENTASSALQDGVNYLNDTLNVREKEGREGGRKGGREGGREGGRKGGREGGREGERKKEGERQREKIPFVFCLAASNVHCNRPVQCGSRQDCR